MYGALYRKWRPRRFDDVVGQQAIVTALRNQVAAGRVGHAYLFTGVRGTGKTTCAKIFAKAVNCLAPQKGDPCCECELCRGIDDGSVLDVVVEHELYGQIRVDLLIDSPKDAREFYGKLMASRDNPLKVLTDDCHYHTVAAPSEKLLDLIEQELQRKGFLH